MCTQGCGRRWCRSVFLPLPWMGGDRAADGDSGEGEGGLAAADMRVTPPGCAVTVCHTAHKEVSCTTPSLRSLHGFQNHDSGKGQAANGSSILTSSPCQVLTAVSPPTPQDVGHRPDPAPGSPGMAGEPGCCTSSCRNCVHMSKLTGGHTRRNRKNPQDIPSRAHPSV